MAAFDGSRPLGIPAPIAYGALGLGLLALLTDEERTPREREAAARMRERKQIAAINRQERQEAEQIRRRKVREGEIAERQRRQREADGELRRMMDRLRLERERKDRAEERAAGSTSPRVVREAEAAAATATRRASRMEEKVDRLTALADKANAGEHLSPDESAELAELLKTGVKLR